MSIAKSPKIACAMKTCNYLPLYLLTRMLYDEVLRVHHTIMTHTPQNDIKFSSLSVSF